METLVRRCAGLDVHKASVVACARIVDENGELQAFTQSFGTTTSDLVALNDWLISHGVSLVGMESTGVYWKPVYTLLETEFECWLLNAQHLRNVPGRKTDIADAAWIAQLVAHGLVRPSFVPPKEIRELRELTRYRKAVIQERSREAQRLHKALEGAGIKLSSVASDILGVSGCAMLDALIGGTHDPDILAELARGKLRKKLPALRKALLGWFSPTHRILVGEMLAHLEYLDESIERLSDDLAAMIAPFAKAIDLLDTIPGVNRRTAEVLVAEIGVDMRRFPSAGHLASWAGMCPGNNESAGKHFSGKARKGSKVAARRAGGVRRSCKSHEAHVSCCPVRSHQRAPRPQESRLRCRALHPRDRLPPFGARSALRGARRRLLHRAAEQGHLPTAARQATRTHGLRCGSFPESCVSLDFHLS